MRTLLWANQGEKKIARHIGEVKRGLACDCYCPGCGAVLEAVNSENPNWKRRPSFRHHSSTEKSECHDASLLLGAKDCLTQINEFLLPKAALDNSVGIVNDAEKHTEADAENVVANVSAYEFIDATDAILTLSNGQQIYVRLTAKPISSSDAQPKQSALAEIIISVADPVLQTADREIMRSHISLTKNKIWCQNQFWDNKQAHKALPSILPAHRDMPGGAQDKPLLIENHNALVAQRPKKTTWNYPERGWQHTGRKLLLLTNHYRVSGGFRPPISTLPFEDIIKEAEEAAKKGTLIEKMLEIWNTRYKLNGNLTPILDVLRVSGLITTTRNNKTT